MGTKKVFKKSNIFVGASLAATAHVASAFDDAVAASDAPTSENQTIRLIGHSLALLCSISNDCY